MGAWSEDTFGNDTACDWKGDFLDNPGLEIVREAIEEALSDDDYLDSHEACNCLAACEVIARLQGQWGVRNAYSEDLDKWIEENPMTVPDELKSLADTAIAKIVGPDSELRDLWDDGGRNDAWHREVEDLRKRING